MKPKGRTKPLALFISSHYFQPYRANEVHCYLWLVFSSVFFSLLCFFPWAFVFIFVVAVTLFLFGLGGLGGSPTTLEKNAWHSDRKWKLLEKRYNSLQVSWRVCLFPTGHFGAASGRKRCLPPRCSSFPVAWKQTETNPLHLPVCLQLAFYFNLINEKCLCSNKMFWILVELHFLKRLALSF